MKLLVDSRWNGDTGIGRMYREIIKRIPSGIEIDQIKGNYSLGNPLSPHFLYKEVIKSSPDFFYSPGFMPPISSKVPFVITIHDLNHLYYYSSFHKFYLQRIIPILAKKAIKIITVSNYTKEEIIINLKIKSEKIEVIYNGVDDKFLSNNEVYKSENPYFLYIGNRRSYKNISKMLEGFSKANIPKDFKLFLSGVEDIYLKDLLKKFELQNRVVFLGFIKEKDLCKIYKGAYALLFVSLMEGFGLPILESMASGTPVITSNVTSMPEIAAEAALIVDPNNVLEIAFAIQTLVSDSILYTNLINKGFERVKDFKWDYSAKKTWNLIQSTK